jgi:hypothetical protein
LAAAMTFQIYKYVSTFLLFVGLWLFLKPGGLDLSRRDLDQDLNLDAQKVSVSTVEKISTVFKS